MWFSLKRTTSSWPKPQVSTGNLGGAEGSAVPRTFPGNVESRPATDLSSRPERTRISCHAPLDKAACAPFFKERRMMFANATQHLQEIRGSVVERPAVSTPVRRVPCSLGKVPCTKGTASAVPHRASTTRALAPEVRLCDHSLQPTNLESVPHRSSSHFPWNVSPSLCHPERTRISYLPALTGATYVVLPKENHMQLAEATSLDRKSGGADLSRRAVEGSAVLRTLPGNVESRPAQICHLDRSVPGFPATHHWTRPRVRLSLRKGA